MDIYRWNVKPPTRKFNYTERKKADRSRYLEISNFEDTEKNKIPVVWIIEHRAARKDDEPWDVVVFGVCSSKQKAIDFTREHLDVLSEETGSWFCIFDEPVDATFGEHNCELISIDREGNFSCTKQPSSPPFLIFS